MVCTCTARPVARHGPCTGHHTAHTICWAPHQIFHANRMGANGINKRPSSSGGHTFPIRKVFGRAGGQTRRINVRAATAPSQWEPLLQPRGRGANPGQCAAWRCSRPAAAPDWPRGRMRGVHHPCADAAGVPDKPIIIVPNSYCLFRQLLPRLLVLPLATLYKTCLSIHNEPRLLSLRCQRPLGRTSGFSLFLLPSFSTLVVILYLLNSSRSLRQTHTKQQHYVLPHYALCCRHPRRVRLCQGCPYQGRSRRRP